MTDKIRNVVLICCVLCVLILFGWYHRYEYMIMPSGSQSVYGTVLRIDRLTGETAWTMPPLVEGWVVIPNKKGGLKEISIIK